MKVINMLNQILGTSYLDEQEAVQDLIREDFIEKFTHEELYYTDIVTRVFVEGYTRYDKNLINTLEEFFNSLPNTELGLRVKKKFIANDLSKNALDTVFLIKSFYKLDYHLNTEDLNLDNIKSTLNYLNEVSTTLHSYLVNYMITDKATTLINKLSNTIVVKEDKTNLTINLGNKNIVYLIIASLLKTFNKDTLKSKTVSDAFYTTLANTLYTKETKDAIDGIIKTNSIENNLDFVENKVVYTTEFIDELSNKVNLIKDNYLTIPKQEIKSRAEFVTKHKNAILSYFIIAIDAGDLYTLTRVATLIRIMRLNCKVKELEIF